MKLALPRSAVPIPLFSRSRTSLPFPSGVMPPAAKKWTPLGDEHPGPLLWRGKDDPRIKVCDQLIDNASNARARPPPMIRVESPVLDGNDAYVDLVAKRFFKEEAGSASVSSDRDNVDGG